MADLRDQKKADLQLLAQELGVVIEPNDIKRVIIKKIEEDPDYDEKLTLAELKIILEEKDRAYEREREEKERAYELEKAKILNQNETLSIASSKSEKPSPVSLKNVMQAYDPSKSEISLFLNLFQRQAKKLDLEENQWTTQLLSLLPIDIAEMILREDEDKIDDFEYVKAVLLKRFRLSPEAFRNKFMHNQKSSDMLWKDWCFDLKNYLEGWLNGLEITDFESLKKLLITDQLKRRATHEMKEHFVDSWSEITDPQTLADKLDHFELVRRPSKRNLQVKNSLDSRSAKHDLLGKEGVKPKAYIHGREISEKERIKAFERKEAPKCFVCGGAGHFKINCPQLKNKGKTGKINFVNSGNEFDESFEPYLNKAEINGREMIFLRDTGSNVDLISRDLIRQDDLNGETIWVKSPLENKFHCLPLAEVKIKIRDREITTKAAVLDTSIEMDHYLLGNETNKLLEQAILNPKLINAIVTRSKARNSPHTPPLAEIVDKTSSEEANNRSKVSKHGLGRLMAASSEDNREKLSQQGLENLMAASSENNGEELSQQGLENLMAAVLKESSVECENKLHLPECAPDNVTDLAKINHSEFLKEQKNDPKLQLCWEKAREGKAKFFIEDGLLFRKTKDHRGNERNQVIIPEKFREGILNLSHLGHIGMDKSKSRLLRYFFWPNAIKDMENYVKSCDPCQRVGNAGDQKRAPLTLVPIITEVFSRLSIDLTGPLPKSENNNKYILTAMCVASKYPEAIPIPDMTSETVVNAMIMIFSRLGFPREIQTDLGRSFVSSLTTNFCEKFGIKVNHSSVHRPQSNVIERWHRSVKRLLKVLCEENKKNWESNLPYAMFALRTTVHASTGFSPSELVHGKNLRTPETLLFEKWTGTEDKECLVTEHVFELVNRLKRCQELAAELMAECSEKRKLWYDRNTVDRKFKVGDKVLVLATIKPNKLAVNWIGPGTIVKQISETNYIVHMPNRREKDQIFHVNLLKPYFGRTNQSNVLVSEKWDPKLLDVDLDISYPDNDPEIFDFQTVVRDSDLERICSNEQIEEIHQVLIKFKDVFSNDPGRTDLVQHDIELTEEKSIRARPYRTSPRQNAILRKEIKRMLELGIIVEGESDYTSPIILVEAPGKDPRPCIDYRKLNAITKAEYFPLPNIEERIEKVASAKFITVIDLTKGYWQIPMTPRAQRLAAFVTNFGTYLPVTMPFGLVGASFRFSKFMSKLLAGLEEFCLPYLDDTAIFSNTWEEHLIHIEVVLDRIRKAKLKVKLKKCRVAQQSVQYLGHVVGNGQRTPAEAKIKAIADFKTPQSKTEIRKFLGLSGFYAKYVENYANIAAPLTNALRGQNKKERVNWDAEMEEAFNCLKTKLTEKPVLFTPDYNREFTLATDASDKGAGVILSQEFEDGAHPVIYLSRKFTGPELNYSTTEKECAAIIFAIKKLRHYLDGQPFTIETDHNPLVWLKNNAGNNPRLLRWVLTLQPFNYMIKHKPGRSIPHVDCLSRLD